MRFKNSAQRAAVMSKYKRTIHGREYWYRSKRVKGKDYPVSEYLGPVGDRVYA